MNLHFYSFAIHLETVSDMATKAFLSAYRRFNARKSDCAHICRDNGITFRSASNILSKILEQLTTLAILSFQRTTRV